MGKSIDITELNKQLTGGNAPTVIDVRRRNDCEATPGRIAGANWHDPEKIDGWVGDIPSGRPTVVYCVRGGGVSQSVVDRLIEEGRTAVFLEGGLKAWIDGGQPVEKINASGSSYAIEGDDIGLLRKAGVPEDDILHSVKVAEKALEIAARTNADLDMELVGRGALFHDLGKAKTHAIEHGRLGAEMGAALGLSEAITAVMEKHIRGGLSGDEAVELGLPAKDYTLRSLEERIIIYADRLVDIITEDIVTIRDEKEAEDRFEEILRTIPKYGKNDRTLVRYLGYHKEIQSLMG